MQTGRNAGNGESMTDGVCHCEEAAPTKQSGSAGLLRFARNDMNLSVRIPHHRNAVLAASWLNKAELMAGVFVATAGTALAAGGTGKIAGTGIGSHIATGAADLLARMPPEVTFAITTLGFGGIAGWSVGFTLKKFAKMVALVIGTVMIVVQALAYRQYLTIHWEKIEQAVPPEGMQGIWMSLMSIVTYNFPFAGSFAVGFYMGFARG